jgi:PPOX class probable F420-dependent enzyme
VRLDDLLPPEWSAFVAGARRAILATIAADGDPRLVPICLVVLGGTIFSPLDEKPKRVGDPRELRRVRNLLVDPRATLIVDRWDEDWTRLAFVELAMTGTLLEPGMAGHGEAIEALRGKYPQYERHRLEERPILRFEPTSVRARWSAAAGLEDPRRSS